MHYLKILWFFFGNQMLKNSYFRKCIVSLTPKVQQSQISSFGKYHIVDTTAEVSVSRAVALGNYKHIDIFYEPLVRKDEGSHCAVSIPQH